MHVRLMKFITKENILFDHQYGFQKNKTTSLTQFLTFTQKIVSSIENNDIACGIFLDFARAFDTVNHSISLQKMEHYSNRGLSLSWLTSYLSTHHQAVKINNNVSDSLEITCGVPQCSVLGPLLFLLYVNYIYKSSTQLSFHLFAEQMTTIYYSHHNIRILQEIINTELKSVAKWLNANKLSPNVSKSSFILFHPPQKKTP